MKKTTQQQIRTEHMISSLFVLMDKIVYLRVILMLKLRVICHVGALIAKNVCMICAREKVARLHKGSALLAEKLGTRHFEALRVKI